jgi:hypothetical protein
MTLFRTQNPLMKGGDNESGIRKNIIKTREGQLLGGS